MHPHSLAVWLLYTTGQLMNAALQIRAISRSKNNPAATFMAALRQQGLALAARTFICTMLLLLFWDNPWLWGKVASWASLIIPGGMDSMAMSPGLAGIFGFASDSALGYLPGLRSAVPKLEYAGPIPALVDIPKSVSEVPKADNPGPGAGV